MRMTTRRPRAQRAIAACASLAAALIALAAAFALAAPALAESYTVRPGDTLGGIAARFGVEVSVLLALNDAIESADQIVIGQELRLPDNARERTGPSAGGRTVSSVQAGGSATSPAAPERYTIQPGDTLWGIAHRFGLSVDQIAALNPTIDPAAIPVGVELRLSDDSAGGSSGESAAGASSGSAGSAGSAGSTSSTAPSQAAVTAAASPAASRSASTLGIEYTVAAGDNATRIAEIHGVTLEELQEANRDSLSVILVGQVLRIPMPDALVPAISLDDDDQTQVLTDYVVIAGDNATRIAEMHGTTLSELLRLNPNVDLNTIYVGQVLKAPWVGEIIRPPGTVPALPARQRTYTVVLGDTFSSIAEQHGLTLEQLRSHNPERTSDLIHEGDRLRLGGAEPTPVVARDAVVEQADLVQYVAADLGVLPETLLANNSWLAADQWVPAGTVLRIPNRDGALITVQPGDTLQGIARYHGLDIADILADPAHGVEEANEIVIGQQIIIPTAIPEFHWPVVGTLTDPFGLCRNWDCSYRHRGLDLAVEMWVPINAAADGLVSFVGGDPCCGLGLYVTIEHPGGWETVYAHLTDFAVGLGQLVQRGETIGYNGNTGLSTGPHLHFEMHHNDWYIDPLIFLP